MRVLLLCFAAFLFLTACGSAGGTGTTPSGDPGGGRVCTGMGAPTGIGIDIDPGLPVEHASLQACWDGSCRTPPIELSTVTEAGPTTCTGDEPHDACSAEAQQTGGQHGFANIAELPEAPVQVTLTLNADDDSPLVHESMQVTPEPVYPNGPDCDSAGPQAQLVVDEHGEVREDRSG